MIGKLMKNTPVDFLFNSQTYRTFVWLWLRYGNVPRYTSHSIHFLKYNFLVPDCASFLGQFREIFFEQIYNFSTPTPAPVIYDCGANIGMSCLYFKTLYPNAKIKAFEADPKIFEILKQNLANNNIHDIELFNKAVWRSNEMISFGTDGADGGSNYQKKGAPIQTEGVRLKDLLKKEAHVDLLKMDVEGAEFEIITDCADSLKKVANLFVEYHSWNTQEQQLGRLLNILTENGFRYYVQTIKHRQTPLINTSRDTNMDLQLNIFAYRDSKISQ